MTNRNRNKQHDELIRAPNNWRKTLNINDRNQAPDQRFSLERWFAAGAHSCRLRKTGSAHFYLKISMISCNLLKARGKARTQGTISCGFASHWFKNWREILMPTTTRSNCIVTFDSHLKTAQRGKK